MIRKIILSTFIVCSLSSIPYAFAQHENLHVNRQVIAAAQQQLQNKGYNIEQINGIQSTDTNNSVILYQSRNGLRPTGQLDIQTLASLGVSVNVVSNQKRNVTPLQEQTAETTTDRGEQRFDENRYDPAM